MTTIDLGNELALTINEELRQTEGISRIGTSPTDWRNWPTLSKME